MLQPRHRHLHDYGRHLHPPLPLLRRGAWPPQRTGQRRAEKPSRIRGRHEIEIRRHHLRGPGRPARRRRTAFCRLHQRNPQNQPQHQNRNPRTRFPRPARHRPGHSGEKPARRDEPQFGNPSAPLQTGTSRRGLQTLAGTPAPLPRNDAAHPHQIRHHGRLGRNRRRSARNHARYARTRHRNDYRGAISSTVRRPPARAALCDTRAVQAV